MDNNTKKKITPVVIEKRVLAVSEYLIKELQITKVEAIGLASTLIANQHVSGGFHEGEYPFGFA